MIAIDTNVFLASFNSPITENDASQHRVASQLLDKISTGTQEAILSEVVLHECFYVMVMRDRKIDTQSFCSLFQRVLAWPGWVIANADIAVFLAALEILEVHPKLEFSDAVIAARAEAYGAELATFDKDLLAIYDGPVWSID